METVLQNSHMCFSLFSQPRGPRSTFPAPSLHSEGSRALTGTRRVQSVQLVRPRTGGLGKLRKPEPRLQRNDKGTSPRLANHGAGKSPSGLSPVRLREQGQSWRRPGDIEMVERRMQVKAWILTRLRLSASSSYPSQPARVSLFPDKPYQMLLMDAQRQKAELVLMLSSSWFRKIHS
ncbi:unnamed protein product [Pleuronectes platessa]|uniref:Uncharacterized protein n=1 Tax=Pleuronectes platessa TaxID=8262 RepID=A0A9N7YED0_PLEPL|nr:unnamed protein product [Pleuronectes platessa]